MKKGLALENRLHLSKLISAEQLDIFKMLTIFYLIWEELDERVIYLAWVKSLIELVGLVSADP